jgi:hypothetical protein
VAPVVSQERFDFAIAGASLALCYKARVEFGLCAGVARALASAPREARAYPHPHAVRGRGLMTLSSPEQVRALRSEFWPHSGRDARLSVRRRAGGALVV